MPSQPEQKQQGSEHTCNFSLVSASRRAIFSCQPDFSRASASCASSSQRLLGMTSSFRPPPGALLCSALARPSCSSYNHSPFLSAESYVTINSGEGPDGTHCDLPCCLVRCPPGSLLVVLAATCLNHTLVNTRLQSGMPDSWQRHDSHVDKPQFVLASSARPAQRNGMMPIMSWIGLAPLHQVEHALANCSIRDAAKHV